MHRKLLLYMLTLVLVVVSFIGIGLFFVGQFSTTKAKYLNNLTFQNEFYTRQVEKFFDDLSMMNEMLATDASAIIDDYLAENEIHISTLNDSQLYSEGVQKALFPKLKEELLKADASGAFIMLNATETREKQTIKNQERDYTFNAARSTAPTKRCYCFGAARNSEEKTAECRIVNGGWNSKPNSCRN